MTMHWIRFILGTVCLLIGLFFIVTSVVGNFRFKFALNRMHSAALGDTLGLLGVILGTCFYNGLNVTTLKLLAIVALVWITSPVASHLLMLMEMTVGKYSAEASADESDEQGFERGTVEMRRHALEDMRKEEQEK